jgi:hypothetical protein
MDSATHYVGPDSRVKSEALLLSRRYSSTSRHLRKSEVQSLATEWKGLKLQPGIYARHLMDGIDPDSGCLICPAFADELIGG